MLHARILLPLLLALVIPFAAAQEAPPSTGIQVVGTGTASGEPDVAVLELGVNAARTDAAKAVSEASALMESVLTALRAAGVRDADIRTTSFNIWREDPGPFPQPWETTPMPRGEEDTTEVAPVQPGRPAQQPIFRVTHIVSVRTTDVDGVGALLSRAVEAGANIVHGIRFDIEDRAALERTARERAMEDARERASQLAGHARAELGPVLAVIEGGGGSFAPMMMERAMAMDAGAAVPVQAGQLSVTVSVTVRFGLEVRFRQF